MDRMAPLRGLRRTALELLMLLVLELCAVSSDLTDGNTEHLKRDHSLTKPYHGELPRLAPLASLQADAARPSVCQTTTEDKAKTKKKQQHASKQTSGHHARAPVQ